MYKVRATRQGNASAPWLRAA